MKKHLLIFIAGLMLIGCSTAGRKQAWEKDSKEEKTSLDDAKKAELEEALKAYETAWADRAKLESTNASIDALKKAWAISKDSATAEKMARAVWFKADTFISLDMVETDDSDEDVIAQKKGEYRAVLKEGIDMIEEALANLNPNMLARLKKGDKMYKILTEWRSAVIAGLPKEAGDKINANKMPAVEINAAQEDINKVIADKGFIGKEGVGLFYFYATCLGKWANAEGFTTVLFYKDRLKAIMDYIMLVENTYFYGGPIRYLGVFYAKAPSFAGGDPQISKLHFDYAVKTFPNYLPNKTIMANWLVPKLQDEELYEKLLTEVQAADLSVAPEIVPENDFAKKEAKLLMELMDDKF